jgi:GTP-binding protein
LDRAVQGAADPERFMSLFSNAEFIASVGKLSELPAEGVPEIVFAGRSNVGKSSAINALVQRRRLAFVSKTPGRTQTINFFSLGDEARLVDLPGYGYARVPLEVKAQWDALVGGYLANRAGLAGIVLIMDIRHPFKPADERLLSWIVPLQRPALLLLSKADKLTVSARRAAEAAARERLGRLALRSDALAFSSLRGEGIEEARGKIAAWLPQK